MINRITYSVVFPTTGAALKGEFKPQPGITAVIGPNESGKTFTTIELTRYLLFGKKALRGPASDYAKLDVEGEFVIRGHTYTFARSSKKETVKDAVGTTIAVGAEEVTNKAAELLGYGLTVFDIANASVQKQADLFGQLRPAERKKLIDEVVGLIDQEKVEKQLRDEGNVLQREAEALLLGHVRPEEPVPPPGYVDSAVLGREYDAEQAKWQMAQSLARKMKPAFEPERPSLREVSFEDFETLLNETEQFRSSEQERLRLAKLINEAVPVNYTEEQLAAAEKRLQWWELYNSRIECPKCGHAFTPDHADIELPDGPDLSQNEITTERMAIQHAVFVADAERQLANWPKYKNPTVELEVARESRNAWEVYRQLQSATDTQLAVNKAAEDELRKLGDIVSDAELDYMREAITAAKIYERDRDNYALRKDEYDKRNEQIVSLQRRAKAFKEGAKLLSEARGSIKSYLAPAISAAASNLMHHMTSGKHSVVSVDEDMNVTVGTQALDTLSGGAATVANLALRLALGQVLVAETFPVFIGDEMDSDADGERRETVADALQSLITNKLLKQIILITHRSVDIADHVHDLGITE